MSRLEELIQELCPDGMEYKRIKDVAAISRGKRVTKKDLDDNEQYPVFQNSLVPLGYYCETNYPKGTTFVICAGAAGEVGYSEEDYWGADDCFSILCGPDIVSRFVYHYLLNKQFDIKSHVRKASVPRLSHEVIDNMRLPVPPLEVQREIVQILDYFTLLTAELTAELTARKEQYSYYRDKILTFGQDVKRVPLEDVILSLNTGLNPRKFFKLNTDDAENYYITIREIVNGRIAPSEKTDRINDEAMRLCNNRSNLEKGDVLFSGTGTIGETAVIQETPNNWNIKEGVYSIKPNPELLDSQFLRYLLMTSDIRSAYMKKVAGGTVKSIPMKELKRIQIPLPTLEQQKALVDTVKQFDKLCSDIANGLPAEIEARQKQYEHYRDKLLTFKEKEA